MVLRIISEHKYICGRAKEESRKGYNETLSFTYINSLSHFLRLMSADREVVFPHYVSVMQSSWHGH